MVSLEVLYLELSIQWFASDHWALITALTPFSRGRESDQRFTCRCRSQRSKPRRLASRASSLIGSAWFESLLLRPSTSMPCASAIRRIVRRSYQSGKPAAPKTPIGPVTSPAINQEPPSHSFVFATLIATQLDATARNRRRNILGVLLFFF